MNVDDDEEDPYCDDDAEEQQTITCEIPPIWSEPIAAIEVEINGEFSGLQQNLDHGTISLKKKRLLLFRADNLTLNFIEFSKSLFDFPKEADALCFAQNLQYQIGYGIGQKSARQFLHPRPTLVNPVVRNNVGFVQSAFMGLAFVELLPQSRLNGDAQDVIITRNKSSFEYNAWQGETRHGHRCHCSFHAGWIAGWSSTATGILRVTAEILCRSKGGSDCIFVTTVANNLEKAIKTFSTEYSISEKTSIPPFLTFRLQHESCAQNPQELLQIRSGMSEDEDVKLSPTPTANSRIKITSRKPTWFEASTSNVTIKSLIISGDLETIHPSSFEGEALSKEKIEFLTAEELDKFLIDPTLATVELADDKCVLIPCEMFSRGFYSMIQKLNLRESYLNNKLFTYHFLYSLGYSTGYNNCVWFCNHVLTTADAVTKFKALPTNLLYFGWSSLKIISGLDTNALQSDDMKFRIIFQANHSFEASTFPSAQYKLKNDLPKSQPTEEVAECVCVMHCGFISGWFHACFGVKVLTAETRCVALGDRRCEFLMARVNHLREFLPANSPKSATTRFLESQLMRSKFRKQQSKRGDDPNRTLERKQHHTNAEFGENDVNKEIPRQEQGSTTGASTLTTTSILPTPVITLNTDPKHLS
eukprot:TRINITY_DN8208_c0_g1_i2.p1 TRINITY_DN8208_c0_g1~~TRINITY_DN8208_c0_g1_i2.p1  ORF type:complete len:727 (+),score=165.29 TRINITY_DN8208_c0_g1_i2:247-2181(+)